MASGRPLAGEFGVHAEDDIARVAGDDAVEALSRQQREVEELRKLVEASGMTEEARKEADRELGRLARMNPSAAEYTVSRTYLDWLVTLPWTVLTTEKIDIIHAKEILQRDHYDLEKIKERILEYLSVLELKPLAKGEYAVFLRDGTKLTMTRGIRELQQALVSRH